MKGEFWQRLVEAGVSWGKGWLSRVSVDKG